MADRELEDYKYEIDKAYNSGYIKGYHDATMQKQEAVKPLVKEDDSYECICGAIVGWDELDASGIVPTRFNFCPFCGKPIDWEGR